MISHIIIKFMNALIPGALSVMFFLIYFRIIPIKKDKDRNEIAYKKLGKIFLILGIVLLLSAILNFI